MPSDRFILLIGAGGHAKSCIDVIELENIYRVAGLIGSPAEAGRDILGYKVIGTDEDLPAFVGRYPHALVAVGQIKSAAARIRLYDKLEALGFHLPLIVSPHARVSMNSAIGAGAIIMHGATVNAGARIGKNCIINSHALIEHDAVVGDHCHISTGATLNGGVTVGDRTFIGSGVHVREATKIGADCVVSMGQRVFRDCANGLTLR